MSIPVVEAGVELKKNQRCSRQSRLRCNLSEINGILKAMVLSFTARLHGGSDIRIPIRIQLLKGDTSDERLEFQYKIASQMLALKLVHTQTQKAFSQLVYIAGSPSSPDAALCFNQFSSTSSSNVNQRWFHNMTPRLQASPRIRQVTFRQEPFQ